MLTRVFSFIEPRATGRNVLIVGGLYLLLTITFQVLWPNDSTGKQAVMLDTTFGYSPDSAYTTIASYGDESRERMLFLNRVIDSIYPFAYIVFDVLFLIWLYRKSTNNPAVWRRLCIIPPITFVTDFFENIPLGFAMANYPERISDTWIQISSVCSQLKWLSTIAFIIAAGVGIYRAYKARKTA